VLNLLRCSLRGVLHLMAGAAQLQSKAAQADQPALVETDTHLARAITRIQNHEAGGGTWGLSESP